MLIFGQLHGTMGAIYKGLIWYFVPSSIVATNDVMAYFTGVAVGRKFVDKPLLQLSPNKTFEGFIGAIFWTALFAFLFTGHVASFKWMTCPAKELTWKVHESINCEPHHVFKPLPPSVLPTFWPDGVPLRPCQLHMVVVSLFASLVGPYGGFLASGIKRAYDIKDFASFLPGHGGLMDRNDCQMLTALFVTVYMKTFIRDL
jgi:phosphatidate cytidylyltransferase